MLSKFIYNYYHYVFINGKKKKKKKLYYNNLREIKNYYIYIYV